MNKKDLRKKYKDLRNQLTEVEIEEKSIAIANRLLQLDTMHNGRQVWDNTYFHLFLTIKEKKRN